MKILLVNPYWIFFPGTNRRPGGPPSIVATVAAALRSYADVSIFDFMASDRTKELQDGSLLWGKSMEEFAAALEGVDAVGFSSTWTAQHPNTRALARFAKAYNPAIRTFAGGHHITVTKESKDIDCIVTGECDCIGKNIVENVQKCYRIDGYPVQNLDDLALLPAYDLLDLDFYKRANRDHHGSVIRGGMPVTTSRGCPYMCNFCTVHLSMGRKWRANSPAYVYRHLLNLQSRDFTKFHFEDDNLMLDKQRWIRIMENMADAGVYEWDTPNAVRLDTLTPDVLKLAKDSGCRELRISVETASDEVRNKVVHKNLSISNIYSVADQCKDLGIRLSAFYVVGIPGETVTDIKNTLKLATKLQNDYGIIHRYSICTPFPGTDLLKECIDKGWLNVPYPYTIEQLAGATHKRGLITTPEFTPEDINTLYAAWREGSL